LAPELPGFRFERARLLGAILSVTGPTVINPILRTLRPTRRVGTLLRWEGIIVDPIGAILAVLVFQGVRAGGLGNALPSVIGTLLLSIAISLGLRSEERRVGKECRCTCVWCASIIAGGSCNKRVESWEV